MRIVFLNSLEKWRAEELLRTAQIWIGEEQGIWKLGWDELAAEEEENQIWYEGDSWSELLHIYRYQLAGKLSGGFRPVVNGIFHEGEKERGGMAQKLFCYSELHYDEQLYEELSVWRRKQAALKRRAPYLIASNRLLKLISAFKPKSPEELMLLPGVGEGKAAEYGAELLELTASREREFGFPLDWVEYKLEDEEFQSWLYKQKESRYKEELVKYNQRNVLLSGIQNGLGLGQLEETLGLVRREAIVLLEQLEKEGYDTDRLLDIELADMPESEQDAVMKAYQDLGDGFLKPIMQRVYGSEPKLAGGKEELERKYEQLRLIRIRYRKGLSSAGVQSA